MPSRTRYARNGDLHIAYQVVGEGPDLLLMQGWISHVEASWQEPVIARFLERLASFSRLILVDKRGTGLSDPHPGGAAPSLEERMDDGRAVLDAVGSERAHLLGISEGGPMNILFAATHPERTAGLILLGTFARLLRDDDYSQGTDPAALEPFLERLRAGWGEGVGLSAIAPSHANDPAFRAAFGRFQRNGASPGMAISLLRLNTDIDVRHVLPAVRVPTLVLHRRDDRFVPAALGRYLADHIPGARFVALPGGDHLYFAGDPTPILDEVEEFVTGHPATPEADRVLATILVSDLVDSTAHASRLGDRRWRHLLDQHDDLVRREIVRARGCFVKSTGDGTLATFDGPARAVRCAQAIVAGVRELGMETRIGLHTGECELRGDDVGGIAVHIAARVAALAGGGEVLCSGTIRDLVAGSGLDFDARGQHALKGVPGEWLVFAVRPAAT
jgi:class 3 adenylate cyclase